MRVYFLLFSLILLTGSTNYCFSQSFSNNTLSIANSWNSSITKTIAVSGMPSTIGSGNPGLIQMNLHMGSQSDGTYNISRYIVTLTSPEGTTITIINGNPNTGTYSFPNSFVREFDCKFRDNQYLQYPSGGSGSMTEPWHIGYYRTRDANAFSLFNGENPNGNWLISITENSTSSGVRFNDASLVFGSFDYVDYTSYSDNDDCSNPYCLRTSEVVIGTNAGYLPQTSDLYNPNTAGCDWNQAQNNSAWFMFVADEPDVQITISGITANLQILGIESSGGDPCVTGSNTILTGGCPDDLINDTYLSPRYSNGSTNNDQLNMSGLTPGVRYYFVVDGTGGAVSPFYIEITGANDTCSDILTPPSQPTATATVSSDYNGADISCFGGSDGSAIVNPLGGQAPFTYQWSSNTGNQTTQEAINLSAGTYSVTISDNNGLSATATVTITQPSQINPTIQLTNAILCNGDDNASLSANVNGGTPSYSFDWVNSTNPGTILSSSQNVSTLSPGTFVVYVTDQNSCIASAQYVVTEPSQLSSSLTSLIDRNCINPGSATIIANGGTPSYTYSWPPGAGGVIGGSANNLNAGTYIVTISDSNNCQITNSLTITDLGGITVSSAVLNNPLCTGVSNGSIDVQISNGTPAFSISWNGGSTITALQNHSITNLAAGNYSVTVTDQNGCQGVTNLVLSNPVELSPSVISLTHAICTTPGNATITTNNGTPPYTYFWPSNASGVNNNSASQLLPGFYQITIADVNSCQTIQDITINNIGSVQLSIIGTNPTCYNYSDGSVSVNTVNGANNPLTYNWSNGSTNPGLTNVTSGTFSLTITDSNGCQASDNLILSNPSQLIPTIVSNPVTCGISGGSAIISIIGGLTPYQYSWSNGFNGTNPQNLDPQTYTVTISDNNSCTIVSTCNIGITGNIPIQIIQPQEILCPGDNTASLSATTSSVNVPMSWIWSTGSQNSSISNLFTGQYNVSVTDSWGCTGTTTWAIEEPELLTTTFNLQNINCRGYNNGRISCSTSGGTEPYSYLWVTGTSGSVLDNLVAGTYSVTTTDNNGCTTSDSGNIMEPSVELAVSTVASNASCFGEDDAKIYSNATGGTPPYSYTWQHLQHLFNVANIYSAFAGNYYLTVTDSENCAAFASVTISEPAQLSLTTEAINPSCTGNNNGEITVYAEGGSAPYSYSWNNGISQLNLISNLIEGNYNITVTDAFGCDMTTGIVELADVDIDCIKIPNAFTPNSDGPNDTWIIEGIGLFPSAEIMVFNRWGQKLFQARGDEEAWDGTYKNKPVPTGPYLYIIQLFNRNESYTGIVTVVY